MQQRRLIADLDGRCRVALPDQDALQLTRTLLVRAAGQSNQEMAVRLANISAVHRAGRLDLIELRSKATKGRGNGGTLAGTGSGARPSDNGRSIGNDGGILDKRAVRVMLVRREYVDCQAAVAKRPAV